MGNMIENDQFPWARGWQGGEEGREESHSARAHTLQTCWTSLSGPEFHCNTSHAAGPREAGPVLGPCAAAASGSWARGMSLPSPTLFSERWLVPPQGLVMV